MYKFLAVMVQERLHSGIEKNLQEEQTGFWQNKCSIDQANIRLIIIEQSLRRFQESLQHNKTNSHMKSIEKERNTPDKKIIRAIYGTLTSS